MIDKIADIIAKAVAPKVDEHIEKITLLAQAKIHAAVQEALKAAFELLDTNDDGKVDLNDLIQRFRG